jgi:hypothetical protein
MPSGKIKSSTGNAKIKKQGQTSSGDFGDSPSKKAKWGMNPRDLKLK